MTLDNLYLNVDRKAVDYRIVIGGAELTEFVSVSYSHAIQKVPSATIRIRGDVPANVYFGAPVTIEEGFVGAARRRVFTGTVLHPDNGDATGKTIECQGMSACLDNSYHKVIITVDGSKTIPQLIADLLDDAGALDYVVNMPSWTAGAVTPQTLQFAAYGEAITKLAEVNGGRWCETPSGVIRVEPKDPIPSLTVWCTYFSMTLTGLTEGYPPGIATGRPRIRRCGQVRRAREVKNQVWVRGGVLTNTNPDGSQTSVTIEEHAYAPSPWVLNPDGSQAYNDELYSNEIIDTVAVAGAEAARRVAVKNVLLTQVNVDIDGDPRVQAGVTVGIEDPSYSAATGRWFVESLTTTLSAGRYQTSLSLLGGPEAGGQINTVPFANFVYAIEHEVIGDRMWAIVTLDGRPSIDPDGHIDRWCWTDNQTPMKATGCGEVLTVRVDPTGIVAPWDVTLTVMDDSGATDDLMLSIPYESTEPNAWLPAIFAALNVTASASPDGGITWNDQVIAGKTVISAAAKPADGSSCGIGVYGTADGCIYRTTDFCATAPTLVQAALSSPIEHVWWDINVQTRVWAVTRDGKVYWSVDDGATWALYEDLAVLFGLATIRLARIGTPTAGGLWIFGGTGTGWPGIWWDANVDHHWTGATIGGELAADLATSGYPVDLYVAEAAARGDVLAIILNSATHTPPVYTSASGGLGDGTDWKRAVGDAGALAKSLGKWIELDLTVGSYVLGFDDNATYRMDVAAGVGTISAAPANFGTNKGNYVLSLAWYENIDGAYLIAAEDMTGTSAGTIYKTWNRFGNVAQVRPATGYPAAPALAKAKMFAFGAPRLAAQAQARILLAGTCTAPKRMAAWREGLANFSHTLFATELGACDRLVPLALTSSLWFVLGFSNSATFSDANNKIVRTKNAGVAWAAYTQPKSGNDYWQDFQLDAGGRLWGLTLDTAYGGSGGRAKVWYSLDEGDTWVGPVLTVDGSGASQVKLFKLITHPTNQNIIIAFGYKFVTSPRFLTWYSLDRGATWAEGYNGTVGDLRWAHEHRPIMLSNGRLLTLATEYPSGAGEDARIYKSDDWGETWAVTFTFPQGAQKRIRGLARNTLGTKVFAIQTNTSPAPDVSLAYMSTDFGNTWQEFDDPIPLPDATYEYRGGVAYDEIEDALYALGEGNLAVNTNLVMKMSPVTVSGSWADVSDTLVPIGAEASYNASGAYIVMIPR